MNETSPETKPVVIYTIRLCSYCTAAKRLFEKKEIPFETVDLTGKENFREDLYHLTGRRTVPQIIIHGTPIGGYKELIRLEDTGVLEKLLSEADPAAGE